jgi:hypothetical protein
VIDVMNLRSDIRTGVEKLGSTVRTLGIDARMPRDIKGLDQETTVRDKVIKEEGMGVVESRFI